MRDLEDRFLWLPFGLSQKIAMQFTNLHYQIVERVEHIIHFDLDTKKIASRCIP